MQEDEIKELIEKHLKVQLANLDKEPKKGVRSSKAESKAASQARSMRSGEVAPVISSLSSPKEDKEDGEVEHSDGEDSLGGHATHNLLRLFDIKLKNVKDQFKSFMIDFSGWQATMME